MNIAILGSGNIGRTLGKKWAAAGHQITFGARNPGDPKYDNLLNQSNMQVATIEAAVGTCQTLLLAIPGSAVSIRLSQIRLMLAEKIIIDATNQVGQAEMNSFAAITAAAPNAKVYRAFSTLGWENFETPQIKGQQLDLFYCGDEGQSKTIVEALITDIGLHPIYLGNREQVGTVDGLTKLWFALVFGQGYGRRLAFKMLTE